MSEICGMLSGVVLNLKGFSHEAASMESHGA
jgi:hypothetical protein